jgi:hypothetical protein
MDNVTDPLRAVSFSLLIRKRYHNRQDDSKGASSSAKTTSDATCRFWIATFVTLNIFDVQYATNEFAALDLKHTYRFYSSLSTTPWDETGLQNSGIGLPCCRSHEDHNAAMSPKRIRFPSKSTLHVSLTGLGHENQTQETQRGSATIMHLQQKI